MPTGFHFRKTIHLGPFFRINLTRGGVGASVGIPGTGISWGLGSLRFGSPSAPLPLPASGPSVPVRVPVKCRRCSAIIRLAPPLPRRSFPCPKCGTSLRVMVPPRHRLGLGLLKGAICMAGAAVIAIVLSALNPSRNVPDPTRDPDAYRPAAVYEPGEASSPHKPSSPARTRSAPPGYHVGPEGGLYRYSRSGRKVYDAHR